MRRVVVLPQPDGPTRVTNSRSLISMVRSSTAVTDPNFLTTPCNRTFATTASDGAFHAGRREARTPAEGLCLGKRIAAELLLTDWPRNAATGVAGACAAFRPRSWAAVACRMVSMLTDRLS